MSNLKALFNSAFPDYSFEKVYNYYKSEYDNSYAELLEEFNNGEYTSENSKCNVDSYCLGQELTLEDAISLADSEEDFDIIVEGDILIKQVIKYEFLPDILTPEEGISIMIESYIAAKSALEIPSYSECDTIKFDTSSVKMNKKHHYSKHFIEHTLKESFERKFNHHSYIGVINALYDKAEEDVVKLSTDFDNCVFNYRNSEYITKSVQVDNLDKSMLKSIIKKYGKFKIVSDCDEMYINYDTVEKSIKQSSEVAVIGIQRMLYQLDERERTIKRIESKLNKIA